MTGRKPKPTALKLVTGNPGKRPLNHSEPVRVPDLPPPPKFLNAAAKAEYRRLGRELLAKGIMTALDRNALALYAQAFANAEEAQERIAAFGSVIKSPQGFLVQSPYVALYNRAVDQMLKIGPLFGLDPSSHSRLHVGRAEDEIDPLDELMQGGKGN